MKKSKLLTADQLVKDEKVLDFLVFGLASSQKPHYTLRDSVSEVDPNVITEIPQILGIQWVDLQTAISKLDDAVLDKKYFPSL